MAIQDWRDAPEIHPSEIRVGDAIGTVDAEHSRYIVKMISGPQSGRKRWTFFGRDDRGQDYASTFGENDLVRRFAKAS
ncbi:hypothetical protein [Mycobacterium asiaticum]|uniref:Uncharacterized protein n=1 Tax=Mycobacterium asiaticum TaxID=1790 RepID=A0A1A3D738_MYCAS|nr:hypothetical protein [Mycobacterium asiaticum]OBI72727.1 hypothetical protein A9X01_07690 [Mycobacterium asiaticum]OBI94788.1 hypothetical protein A5661_23065 [Mycobacterium asiaticum]OBJ59337.1 hypothetical protein A9W94_01245 [Mycobacterium asiaticum]OBJ89865.1 hypothetical protein A5640_24975 [Mycobacterium asiaticum]OBK26144.1 hypothetical protein A5635_14350 [Mycobacterium asiaticum]